MKSFKKLNLTSLENFFVSYDLSDIKNIKHCKASEIYSKKECEGNGVLFSDSIIVLKFNDGHTTSFGSNWIMTFG